MERYSEYRDSGVKWLGEIPSHWKLLKSKYLWKETFENSTSGKEDLLSVSQYTGVTKSKADSRSESLVGYKIVHKDDLVINIMLAWLGGLGVSNDEGIVSPAYCTYKLTRDYNPKFLHYLYKTPMYLAEFARHSTGVVPSRWRMYTDDFGQVVSLLPPMEEQDAIVRYLDAATSKIDKAIAMQQKMIDQLNERKQIIIQNAVTKGLDENVEMKDSGVEWIGLIPKNWEIVRLSRLTSKIGSGSTPKEGYVDNGVIFLRSQNVYCEGLRLDDVVHISQNVHRKMSGTRVLSNDVLINITGGSIGRCFYVDETLGEANVNQHVSIIRPTSVDTHYLKYYLQSYCGQIQVALEQTGGNREGLTAKALAKFLIVCPPKFDQQAVADYLDKQMQRFDSAITNCQRQITLLQERKQIIINEVVTGKVKVS